MRSAFFASCLALGLVLAACANQPDPMEKIAFDLDRLDEDGLQGPPDGLRALSYEFCIPDDEVRMAEVKRIDPSAQFFPRSRGRVGCGENEVLVIGSTHQVNYRNILLRLAKLDYIDEIQEAHFE